MKQQESISWEQKSIIKDLKIFYNAKQKCIKLFDGYNTIVSKATYDAKHINGLQRLPIALAQLKSGNTSNTSENSLNQVRQIIHSLHRVKENTKKVYNAIMNSVKL